MKDIAVVNRALRQETREGPYWVPYVPLREKCLVK